MPNNALFHAEANALLRAEAGGRYLSGRTIDMRVDRILCPSCDDVLPLVRLHVGNPTVRITDGAGAVWIMRDGGSGGGGHEQVCPLRQVVGFWLADPHELQSFFLAPPGKEWSYLGGNDGWRVSLEGVDETEHLHRLKGCKDIQLTMWGNPSLGVLLQYSLVGRGVPRQDWFSKGDLTKLKRWVRTMHADLMPVGLYIPFPKAWLAAKEFMETGASCRPASSG